MLSVTALFASRTLLHYFKINEPIAQMFAHPSCDLDSLLQKLDMMYKLLTEIYRKQQLVASRQYIE